MGKSIKIISHRGNLNGPSGSEENSLNNINIALDLGFDVEIDVWYIDGVLYLGHDAADLRPYNHIESFLTHNSDRLWIHCKNMESLGYLLNNKTLNVFGHSDDEYVLTSKHNIFCRPGVLPNFKSIIVMPEITPTIYIEDMLINCYGVLTDYPVKIRDGSFELFNP